MGQGESYVRRQARTVLAVPVLLLSTLALCVAPTAADATCANETLRLEQGAARLPDCRAYEMVTPTKKYGSVGLVNGGELKARATSDGEGLFSFEAPYQQPESGSANASQIFSGRSGTGWLGTDLAPASTDWGYGLDTMTSFSADGRTQLFTGGQPVDPADGDFEYKDLYLRHPDGTFSFVTEGVINQNAPTNYPSGLLSADGTHVVFASEIPMLPEDEARTGPLSLYDWHDGVLELVNVNNAGELLSPSGATLGFATNFFGGNLGVDHGLNPVSRDGSRIFFTTEKHVYLREDGTTTRRLAPAGTSEESFMGATPDGSKAYIATDDQLTPDDHDSTSDLYEFDTESGALKRLSDGASHSAEGAEVTVAPGVRVSDDGSLVYFVAEGTPLAPGASAGRNLYVTDGSTTRLVAPIGGVEIGFSRPIANSPGYNPDSGWRVTPDGSHLVFRTPASLISADQDGGAVDLYEYDDTTGALQIVSAGPTDANTSDNALIGTPAEHYTNNMFTEPRVMSDDGRFTFFATKEPLVPGDTNEARDVYEHDFATDTTSLISSGTDATDSTYLDNGASGRDVFFVTAGPLAAQDEDHMMDIYDARSGGGFPWPTDAPAPCSGDACQGALGASPPDDVPGSSTIFGSGNVEKSCGALSQRAHDLARRAASLRRRARTAGGAAADRLRTKATRLHRRSQRLGAEARRCRSKQRGAGR